LLQVKDCGIRQYGANEVLCLSWCIGTATFEKYLSSRLESLQYDKSVKETLADLYVVPVSLSLSKVYRKKADNRLLVYGGTRSLEETMFILNSRLNPQYANRVCMPNTGTSGIARRAHASDTVTQRFSAAQ